MVLAGWGLANGAAAVLVVLGLLLGLVLADRPDNVTDAQLARRGHLGHSA